MQSPTEDRIKALFVTDDDYWQRLKASKDVGTEYELSLAKSDELAIGMVRNGDYDIIISDSSVEYLDSITILKDIRYGGSRIPYILLTGKGDEEIAVEALENGVDFYLEKADNARLHFAELTSMIYQSVQKSRMEVELSQSRADLLGIFENSPTMIALVNESLKVILINSAMEDFIGGDASAIIGKRIGDATHCIHSFEDPKGCGHGLFCSHCQIREALESTFSTGNGVNNAEVEQEELRGINKRKFSLRITTALLTILGKRMVAVYIEDITEQKRMQTAILMANKKLNLLGSVTRHDIVNQLSVLMGNLEIASMKDPRSPLIRYLKKAMESGENISTILAFSKDYQLMGTEVPSWTNIRESCMRGIATVDAPEIKVHIETGDIQIFADRMLEKVFLNLMDNTIRHGEKVKNIWVRFKIADGELALTYEDDGVGVPQSEKEKIFQFGYGKHTGLGLYLVREILGITNITIEESGTEGKGVRFVFHVPSGSFIGS